MTTAEKEKRIMDLGTPWVELMDGMNAHRSLTEAEKQSHYPTEIAQSREDYYANALSVILECAWRQTDRASAQ